MKRLLHPIPVVSFFFGGIALSLLGTDAAHAQGCCWGQSRPPAYPVGAPIPVNPTPPAGTGMGSYYGSYGMYPPSPGTFLPAGIPQTSAAFMPTAAYDTRWVQTPVTYYRPVTQFDPNYGTTVTSLQPCTSYQYQAARVPLISPRMISDYSYSANRWPAVTSPGYYPTALTPAANMVPTMQQIPATGMPVTSNMMSFGPSGTSSGPATTLPLATMGPQGGSVVTANHAAPFAIPSAPAPVSQATAWMPATAAPMSQVPITSAIPGTGTPIYTVPNTATPSGLNPCPNGVCIPGAASVVPMGPPTLVSPSNVMPPSSTAPTLAPPTLGPSTSASIPSMAPSVTNPILPNPGEMKPVLPPSLNADPEATRPPSLGSSAAMYPLKRIPLSDVDRSDAQASQSLARQHGVSLPELAAAPSVAAPSVAAPAATLPNMPPPPVPTTLQPLRAPSDFDAKPRWNPKLLPPPPSQDNARETVASTPSQAWGTV